MKLVNLLKLDFLPLDKDFGLLILRAWIGLSMLANHGWGKLITFSEKAGSFPDPFGIGSPASLVLVVAAEVLGSLLIAFGFLTRLAALGCTISMGVAFFMVHHAKLNGAGNGELAFIYLAAYVTLFVTGAGHYSVDAKFGKA